MKEIKMHKVNFSEIFGRTLEMCECLGQCVGIFYDNYLHENYGSIIKLKY